MSAELAIGHDGTMAADPFKDFGAPAAAADGPDQPRVRSPRAPSTLAQARTCYDHLAGRLGVQVTAAMTSAGLIDQHSGLALTQTGLDWLAETLEIDVDALSAARRPLARSCIDWTERRPHLAGGAGAAMCAQFFARGWIRRTGPSRAVVVTPAGDQALRRLGLSG